VTVEDKRPDQIRSGGRSVANGAELRSEEKPAQLRTRRRETSQVATSGRRYFRVIVAVTVDELSNKTASCKLESTIVCHGTPDTWNTIVSLGMGSRNKLIGSDHTHGSSSSALKN
jgi:hypothetical protein